MSAMSDEFEEFVQLLKAEVGLPPWDSKPVNELIYLWFMKGRFVYSKLGDQNFAEYLSDPDSDTRQSLDAATAANIDASDSATYTSLTGVVEAATDAVIAGEAARVADTTTGIGAAIANLYQRRPLDLLSDLTFPQFVAHRGAMDLYPEHSFEGFEAAAEWGFPLEYDVRALGDGTLVLNHDSDTVRTLVDANGDPVDVALSSLTLEEWKELRVKPSIKGGLYGRTTTVDEMLETFAGRSVHMPEVKEPTLMPALIASIHKHNMARSCLVQVTQGAESLALAKQVAAAGLTPIWQTAPSGATESQLTEAKAAGIEHLECPISSPTSYFDLVKSAGLNLWVYTSSSPNQISTALSNGVDAVFTDDPFWISHKFQRSDEAPWWKGARWPGSYLTGNEENISIDPEANALRFLSTGFQHMLQGWAWPHGPYVEVNFLLRFGTAGASDGWAGVFLGITQSGGSYLNGNTSSSQHGWHLLIRRNGLLADYTVSPNANASLSASQTSPVIAGTGVEGVVPIRIVINEAGVSLTRTDIDVTAYTDIMPVGGRPSRINLSLGHGSSQVSFENLTIRDIAAA